MNDVTIIGGGLAGLISAILLSRNGLKVALIEKKAYPFHRVCGEYISNEVIPFLENHNLFPDEFEPARIDRLQISSVRGRSFSGPLDLGGFGISRYAFDHWLSQKATEAGAALLTGTTATNIDYDDGEFRVSTHNGEPIYSKLVIGAYGKRAKLDQTLSRSFLKKKSPYVGVKYHLKTNFPDNQISLHNFEGGYCGISKIEGEKFNLCYLVHRDQLKKQGSIEALESEVLAVNPYLNEIFKNSDILFEKPEVINEITFDKQEPVLSHILMCGDAAGMITPLCGNGMAMAMHSARTLSGLVIEAFAGQPFNRDRLERAYTQYWKRQHAFRLWSGRKIQELFGSRLASGTGVFIGKYCTPLTKFLIRQTHGQPFS